MIEVCVVPDPYFVVCRRKVGQNCPRLSETSRRLQLVLVVAELETDDDNFERVWTEMLCCEGG